MQRVEIHTTISGHGWGSTEENCAEFCVTQHKFGARPAVDVNGQLYVAPEDAAFVQTLAGAGDSLGCASHARVRGGVTPNQYGTWQYGRAGWCPGGEVRTWRVDVTASAKPGMDMVVTYEGLYNSSGYRSVPAASCLAAELVCVRVTHRAACCSWTLCAFFTLFCVQAAQVQRGRVRRGLDPPLDQHAVFPRDLRGQRERTFAR